MTWHSRPPTGMRSPLAAARVVPGAPAGPYTATAGCAARTAAFPPAWSQCLCVHSTASSCKAGPPELRSSSLTWSTHANAVAACEGSTSAHRPDAASATSHA